MDSLGLEPESVDNLDMYSHIPPVLMEKCAALSVRPDTVKSLIQSMQGKQYCLIHSFKVLVLLNSFDCLCLLCGTLLCTLL